MPDKIIFLNGPKPLKRKYIYNIEKLVPRTLTNQPSYLRLQFLLLFFLTIFPNPPCQLPCGRKPENPEKTHDFWQSVDQLFPRVIKCPNTGFELLTSEVRGSRSQSWSLGHRSPTMHACTYVIDVNTV